jgi:hypothetical protein
MFGFTRLTHLRVLLLFGLLALAFSWPLPLHLSTHLTAPVDSDGGVYVWNQWVFRHELVEHRTLPYFTGKIFSMTARANLSLHNYTTFANILALPLMGVLGVVATFNVVYLLTIVLSAYAMFLLARRVAGSDAEAILAAIAFAWSPVLVTRGMGHFSLVAAAPLPVFLLLLTRAEERWRVRDGALLGAVVAWAATTDVYYAVFCLLIGAAYMTIRLVQLHPTQATARRAVLARTLDVLIVSLLGLVAAILIGRGWSVTFLGARISIRGLYTPMLALTVLLIARAAVRYHASIPRLDVGHALRFARAAGVAVIVAVAILSPVLYALADRWWQDEPLAARPLWRSSPRGVDFAALVLPNPNHPLAPQSIRDFLTPRPDAYLENVASIPLVLLAVLALAWRRGWRPPREWLVLTAFVGLLALGPFIYVAGVNTHVPGPWALLRYVPVVELVRTPARFSVVLMVGMAVLFALALRELGRRAPARRRLLLGTVAALLAFELLPIPRPLSAATVPTIYERIAADPRPHVRVLELPFGLRDGTQSIGNFTARTQFYQTMHQKPIVGGYLSRVSRKRIRDTRRHKVLDALIRLSADRKLPVSAIDAMEREGARFVERANLGYVVIDRSRASEALVEFAHRTFCLELLERDGPLELYRPAR